METFYQATDYKDAIRARVKELQRTQPTVNLKWLAERIPIQYTYLSKVLNDPSTHLGEDHLYQVAQILSLYPQETDHLLLLRSYQTTENPARKQDLYRRLQESRKDLKVHAEKQGSRKDDVHQISDVNYLIDPLCSIVYVALHVRAVREDPRQLCSVLGITLPRLKRTLQTLETGRFLELGIGGMKIEKLLERRLHYSKEHPLMRVHQFLVSMACEDQLMKLDEEDKERFQATFTIDAKGFEEIRSEYRSFIQRVEGIARKSKDKQVAQLNFELFRWI